MQHGDVNGITEVANRVNNINLVNKNHPQVCVSFTTQKTPLLCHT